MLYEIGVEHFKAGITFGEVVDLMEKPLLESGDGMFIHLFTVLIAYGPIGFVAPGIESLPLAHRYKTN